jgi:hypothetical protein
VKLRWRRLLLAGAIGTSVALSASGIAQAATLNTSPQWRTADVNMFRATGSETTFYVLNQIGNLYSQAAIFGCTLQSVDLRTCNTAADGANTDVLDNYSRNEFVNGEGIGSGNGIGQLCGTKPTGGLPVDFARSSRAPQASDNCATAVGLQFAKDSLVGVYFPFNNTSAVTCSGGSCVGQIGPVSRGWRTGDPLAGPYSGVEFTNIDNTASASLGGASLSSELYCDKTGS